MTQKSAPELIANQVALLLLGRSLSRTELGYPLEDCFPAGSSSVSPKWVMMALLLRHICALIIWSLVGEDDGFTPFEHVGSPPM